ncbi:short-chain dehydrogenase [Streptomyces marincola]|uniref:Short-chain dehydrogenase n=1 Tax=Streptomyces marincola TaxID=2878388 RepID=A0A1W7D747_9ACTN|nr:SDR family oxidoreductase [Streptomyces marincola]ARQ72420.1 short-chain dehydrogenase [Streptomyces marincola]
MRTARAGLAGQTVVVTGAARGIGAALARHLSARGARLALVGLEPDELARVADSLPGECAHWHADVTDAAAMREAAAGIVRRFGRVDTVVANAGVATGGPFADADEATWRRVIEVNVIGSAVTCRAFLPALVDSRGYFLQIASFAAMAPAPLMTAYCASKSGVEAFAHSLRAEVAPSGVRVGVGYLSWTDTDMVRGADEDDVLAETRARLPWPANRTCPLEPAVRRLADGVARRAAHVYGQGWLRAAVPVRGFLPALIGGRLGQREMRRVAPRLSGTRRRGLVGAGGAAAERERRPGTAAGDAVVGDTVVGEAAVRDAGGAAVVGDAGGAAAVRDAGGPAD